MLGPSPIMLTRALRIADAARLYFSFWGILSPSFLSGVSCAVSSRRLPSSHTLTASMSSFSRSRSAEPPSGSARWSSCIAV